MAVFQHIGALLAYSDCSETATQHVTYDLSPSLSLPPSFPPSLPPLPLSLFSLTLSWKPTLPRPAGFCPSLPDSAFALYFALLVFVAGQAGHVLGRHRPRRRIDGRVPPEVIAVGVMLFSSGCCSRFGANMARINLQLVVPVLLRAEKRLGGTFMNS